MMSTEGRGRGPRSIFRIEALLKFPVDEGLFIGIRSFFQKGHVEINFVEFLLEKK